jgi:hypothetical protein
VSRRKPPVEQDGPVLSPICIREKHCGHRAVLGEKVPGSGATVNRSITCLKCGATGVQSTRTDL